MINCNITEATESRDQYGRYHVVDDVKVYRESDFVAGEVGSITEGAASMSGKENKNVEARSIKTLERQERQRAEVEKRKAEAEVCYYYILTVINTISFTHI